MGLKLDDVKAKRRQFILDKTSELLKNGECKTTSEAYLYIADNLLFCCVDTIYRALRYKKSNV